MKVSGVLTDEEYIALEAARDRAVADAVEAAVRAAWDRYGDSYAYDHLLGEICLLRDAYRKANPRPKSKSTKKEISHILRRRVYERDKYRCVNCDTHLDLTIDHIIPESKGGPTEADNLQTLCRPCNSRKGTKMEGAA